ncbi:hypothetical protein CCP4SC76_5300004 [Gammaproteobacteria bacterium]
MDYWYGSHTVFKIEYHFVCVMKYRYKTSEWNHKRVFDPYPDFQSVMQTHRLLAGGCLVFSERL